MSEKSEKISFSDFIRMRRDEQTAAWEKMSDEDKSAIRSAWYASSKLLTKCQDLIINGKRYSHNDQSTWPSNKKSKIIDGATNE